MQPLSCLFKARDPSRAVIAVSGKGVKEFLQGLYTNDVTGADTARDRAPFVRGTSQYGCFLSGTGRTLFDGFITDISLVPSEAEIEAAAAAAASAPKPTVSSGGALSAPPPATGFSNEMVLVDVAANVRELAMQHFRDFKLRRKIKITDISSYVGVYVETIRTAPACASPTERGRLVESLKNTMYEVEGDGEEDASIIDAAAVAVVERHVQQQQAAVDAALVASDNDPSEPLMVLDPRYGTAVEGSLGDFSDPPEGTDDGALPPPLPMVLRRGYKFLGGCSISPSPSVSPTETATRKSSEGESFRLNNDNASGIRAYRSLVESLCGVPANSRVFLPNKGLPFEGNIDQLWGVSFEKGCYLGQELTHRTHVMLVCRKRVVPIVLGHFESREDILRVVGGFSEASQSDAGGEVAASSLTFNVDDLTLRGLDMTVDRGIVWGEALVKQDIEHILPLSSKVNEAAAAASSSPPPAQDKNKAPSTERPTRANRSTNPANAIGNRLYVLTDVDTPYSPSVPMPDPSKLAAVGHVTQGQYNVGAGLVRLRYMNAETRTMKLYIKTANATASAAAGLPEYVPATAFIPLWWAEEVVSKVLSASSEAEE